MARKKSTRTARRRRSSEPLPGWAWMLFGLAVGLAVAVAIYVNDRRLPVEASSAPRAVSAPAKAAKAPPAARAEPEEPEARFDFYNMLPKFEIIIPEQDLDARPDVTPAAVEKPGAYVLQAGSFSTFADADRMKAQLALLGVSSRIQKVSVDERTYHRVRIGPLEDLDELNRTREQLRDARVEVLVIRVAD